MKRLFWIIPLPFLIFIACRGTAQKKENQSVLKFEMRLFEKSETPCNAERNNCTHLRFQYPEFTQASNLGVKDILNQTVRNFLLEPIFQEKTDSLDALARNFFTEHQKLMKEFPEVPSQWMVEKNVQIVNQTPKGVSLSLDENQYTGGAHPNSALVYANINLADGSLVKLSDLLIPGYEAKLNAIGEKKFREMNHLAPTANLNDAGFFFKEGKFYLNENFSVGPQSLTFYYNPYEIAPYAMGPITLSLDYSEIKDLIRPDGFLGGGV